MSPDARFAFMIWLGMVGFMLTLLLTFSPFMVWEPVPKVRIAVGSVIAFGFLTIALCAKV